MAIDIKFKIEGSDVLYDDPMDAAMEAAYMSQQDGGSNIKLMRGVKYTRSQEYKWTSLGSVTLPADVTDKGPIAVREDDYVNNAWGNNPRGLKR